MKLADTYEARKELAKAVAVIQAACQELEKDLSNDAKLKIVWNLAMIDLRNLEEFRVPE